jgi:hypothetical protein
MLTTRYPVDFVYTHQELQALFPYADDHDVEQGGRYDARSAAINIWAHHRAYPATREESETIGTFYVHWEPPALYEIETDEGFSLEDLMQELGRLELQALGRVKHGDVPPAAAEDSGWSTMRPGLHRARPTRTFSLRPWMPISTRGLRRRLKRR